MTYQRYALYYAPIAQTTLAEFGNQWLGWDAEIRTVLQSSAPDHWISDPARYGFHGTLKPPFFLKDGIALDELENEIQALAAQTQSFECAPLKLSQIGKFLALVPSKPSDDLAQLASDCVKSLDQFRQAPSDQELERRRKANLSPRQEEYLQEWGYPYVLDEFRFHLTLTNSLDPEDLTKAHEMLQGLTAPLTISNFAVKEICLFGDLGQGKAFHLINRFSLSKA